MSIVVATITCLQLQLQLYTLSKLHYYTNQWWCKPKWGPPNNNIFLATLF